MDLCIIAFFHTFLFEKRIEAQKNPFQLQSKGFVRIKATSIPIIFLLPFAFFCCQSVQDLEFFPPRCW
uniref:Uncharacterized protein n=1 Tax=Salix viminalis TaxID=40686 RepID=A0A6N2MKM1_SALVM